MIEKLNQIKQKLQQKVARKELWANIKRLFKRDQMTWKIYKKLL